MNARHRVVIIGGGFGGLNAAKALSDAAVDVTLLDMRNFHLFQPLLYQVATGGLSPANIAAPLRSILKYQNNARVLLGEAVGFDPEQRKVLLADAEVEYDTLIVAAGARNFYFGHQEWANLAPGLKTIEDSTEIRRRILLAFEAAERCNDPELVKQWLTFVIIGGGPTGVELAGALREIAMHTLRKDFRNIASQSARVILVEGSDRLLRVYPAGLSEKARRSAEELGVEIRCGVSVTAIDKDGITVQVDGREERLAARTVLWAAGVRGVVLGEALAEATKTELDRGGRVFVDDHLNVPGYPDIFVIGDLACAAGADGQPLPGVAPVAIQQGNYVARAIQDRLAGRSVRPFRYFDKGSMATIGRSRAVAMMGRLSFSGMLAWLAWLFVHLMYIVSFENRLLIMFQWAWNYLTFSRTARLITGDPVCPFRNPECPRKKKAQKDAAECEACRVK